MAAPVIRRGVLLVLGLTLVLPLPRTVAAAQTTSTRGEFSTVERLIGCEEKVRIHFTGRFAIHTTTTDTGFSTHLRLVGRLTFTEGEERFRGRFTESFGVNQREGGTKVSFTFSARSKSDLGRHATFHAIAHVKESSDGDVAVGFRREKARCR